MSERGRENSLISLYSNSDCDNESLNGNVYIDYDELQISPNKKKCSIF